MTDAVEITLNGEQAEVPAGATISDLLGQIGLKDSRVAVEVDEVIIPASQHDTHEISAGASIEIVHAIGGG